eukprot:TRINITY_DN62556_c0_g1_i1.p1 TRINITY_DN62556_c0_g1~~TRINITY_DN62556_c0_g1_i1.p1  ORF type:complete len:153 (-),score=36.09 TRINITY_DN62556_c0_g1_i1:9-467(-)
MDYDNVLHKSRKSVDAALTTIADSWQCLGLAAEGAGERFSSLQTRLEDFLKELVQGELDHLETIKTEVGEARKFIRSLAAEIHEPLPEGITKPRPLLQQLEELAAERKRLEELKERRDRVPDDSEGELSEDYTYTYSEAEEQQQQVLLSASS